MTEPCRATKAATAVPCGLGRNSFSSCLAAAFTDDGYRFNSTLDLLSGGYAGSSTGRLEPLQLEDSSSSAPNTNKPLPIYGLDEDNRRCCMSWLEEATLDTRSLVTLVTAAHGSQPASAPAVLRCEEAGSTESCPPHCCSSTAATATAAAAAGCGWPRQPVTWDQRQGAATEGAASTGRSCRDVEHDLDKESAASSRSAARTAGQGPCVRLGNEARMPTECIDHASRHHRPHSQACSCCYCVAESRRDGGLFDMIMSETPHVTQSCQHAPQITDVSLHGKGLLKPRDSTEPSQTAPTPCRLSNALQQTRSTAHSKTKLPDFFFILWLFFLLVLLLRAAADNNSFINPFRIHLPMQAAPALCGRSFGALLHAAAMQQAAESYSHRKLKPYGVYIEPSPLLMGPPPSLLEGGPHGPISREKFLAYDLPETLNLQSSARSSGQAAAGHDGHGSGTSNRIVVSHDWNRWKSRLVRRTLDDSSGQQKLRLRRHHPTTATPKLKIVENFSEAGRQPLPKGTSSSVGNGNGDSNSNRRSPVSITATGGSPASQKTSITIGCLFANATVGSVIRFAVDKINNDSSLLPNHRLDLVCANTSVDAIGGMLGGIRALRNHPVAIIGPSTSSQSAVVSRMTKILKVPAISYGATDPTLTFGNELPFFARTIHNDELEMRAIAELLVEFLWEEVIMVYMDNRFGRNGVAALSKSFKQVSRLLQITYAIPVDSKADLATLQRLLEPIARLSPSAIILHTFGAITNVVFSAASSLGLMSKGYVWISTEGAMVELLRHPINETVEGLVSMTTFIPPSTRLDSFLSAWKSADLQRYPEAGQAKADIFMMSAYDATYLVAHALHDFISKNPNTSLPSHPLGIASLSNTTLSSSRVGVHADVADLAVSVEGPLLMGKILSTSFDGVTGPISLTARGDVRYPQLQISNLRSDGSVTVGLWDQTHGLMRLVHDAEGNASVVPAEPGEFRSMAAIQWPGGSLEVPRGWMPKNVKPLRIAVTKKMGFAPLISLMPEGQASGNDRFSGLFVEIFRAAVRRLPYNLSYVFIEAEGRDGQPANNTQLCYDLANNLFDGIVGDLDITLQRAAIVDFTQPILQGGPSLITYSKEKVNMWSFAAPFSYSMWAVIYAAFGYTALIVWLLESPTNSHFQGRIWQQMVSAIWFSAATFYSLLEKPVKTIWGRYVVSAWLFVVFVLNVSYVANLTSLLTVQELTPKIQSVNQIVASSGVKVGYQAGSFVGEYLTQFGVTEAQLVPLSSEAEYVAALTARQVAVIIDRSIFFRVLESQFCDFLQAQQPLFSLNFGFAFQRGSPMVREFSDAIVGILQSGELQRLLERWLGAEGASNCQRQKNLQLGIQSFGGVYIIFAIISVVCVICYVFLIALRGHQAFSEFNEADETDDVDSDSDDSYEKPHSAPPAEGAELRRDESSYCGWWAMFCEKFHAGRQVSRDKKITSFAAESQHLPPLAHAGSVTRTELAVMIAEEMRQSSRHKRDRSNPSLAPIGQSFLPQVGSPIGGNRVQSPLAVLPGGGGARLPGGETPRKSRFAFEVEEENKRDLSTRSQPEMRLSPGPSPLAGAGSKSMKLPQPLASYNLDADSADKDDLPPSFQPHARWPPPDFESGEMDVFGRRKPNPKTGDASQGFQREADWQPSHFHSSRMETSDFQASSLDRGPNLMVPAAIQILHGNTSPNHQGSLETSATPGQKTNGHKRGKQRSKSRPKFIDTNPNYTSNNVETENNGTPQRVRVVSQEPSAYEDLYPSQDLY